MSNAALLIMDMQNGIVERFSDGSKELLANVASAQTAAREKGIAIIYVRVAFRDGAPEANPRNKSFSALAGSGVLSENGAATQVHESLAPVDGEITVTKRRVSAFAGSDLDVVLRSLDVDSLVLTGIATSGVVLSTTRQAADLDFKITILSDACADADPEVHRVLMEKVFPRQATVTTTEEWTTRPA
jgi:nicotinamidase-related amidase